MNKLNLHFVLFDMIGTTVQDVNANKSLILTSFHQAFAINGYEIPYQTLNQQRGKSKQAAIQYILESKQLDTDSGPKIYSDFMNLLNNSINDFHEIKNASIIFQLLKSKGIRIGIGSGLPISFMLRVMENLNWDKTIFDYISSSDELGIGRPNPIMITDAMDKLDLKNKSAILKIGDTKVDIQEGKDAGVLTALVLTGTQGKRAVDTITPDFILKDIAHLSYLL